MQCSLTFSGTFPPSRDLFLPLPAQRFGDFKVGASLPAQKESYESVWGTKRKTGEEESYLRKQELWHGVGLQPKHGNAGTYDSVSSNRKASASDGQVRQPITREIQRPERFKP